MSFLRSLALAGIHITGFGNMNINGYLTSKTVLTTEALTGNRVLTAAEFLGGLLALDPGGSDRNLTLPTVATIISALGGVNAIGNSFEVIIENTANEGDEELTLVAGSGMTLDPTSIIIYPSQMIRLKAVFTAIGDTPTMTIYQIGGVALQVLTQHVNYYDVAVTTAADPNDLLDNTTLTSEKDDYTVASPPHPRNLLVFIENAGGAAVGGTVIIEGTDQNGLVISETFTFAAVGGAGDVQTGALIFATVTKIEAGVWTALDADEKINVGWGDLIGVPSRPGGVVTSVIKASKDQGSTTVSALNEETGAITITGGMDAAYDLEFWYTFI